MGSVVRYSSACVLWALVVLVSPLWGSEARVGVDPVARAVTGDIPDPGTRHAPERTLTKRATSLKLLYFSAEWCAPCRRMPAEIEEAVGRVDVPVKVRVIDVDRRPAVAARHEVMAVPSIVVLEGGREILRRAGFVAASRIAEGIESSRSN